MREPSTEQTSRTTDTPGADIALPGADIAFRLLELQQKLEAWDCLYNEEVAELRKELSLLTADYLRGCQTQRQTARARRQRRGGSHPQGGEGRTTRDTG